MYQSHLTLHKRVETTQIPQVLGQCHIRGNEKWCFRGPKMLLSQACRSESVQRSKLFDLLLGFLCLKPSLIVSETAVYQEQTLAHLTSVDSSHCCVDR